MAYQQGSSFGSNRNSGYDSSFGTATMTPVIHGSEEDRASFLVKVYQHLALAVAAFIAIETVFFMTGLAEGMYNFLASSGRGSWMLILGGFMVINWFASQSVNKLDNIPAQYGGLFGIAFAQALIFAPFLYQVFNYNGAGTVATAAIVTLMGFAGLTLVAFVTRRDLNFLRPIVTWGFMAALVLIIGGVIFGFNLGLFFSVGMVALSGASILYQTQNIIRRYPSWAYVGAAVALFGSLMTMFWYILRIFSRR